MKKTATQQFSEMKRRGEKIAALTAYDYVTARIADEAGIPLLLVGDSLGMVVLGYESTLPVTMEEMLHHTRAVARAKPRAVVISDLPFRSYETPKQSVANARRFIEAGADGVKLEGGEAVSAQIRAVIEAGIPVLGHIGLLPQSATSYKLVGRSTEEAEQLLRDARLLEEAGAFAVVIECVMASLAARISKAVSIPTIGIGSGSECNGQILVVHDLLGLTPRMPKHAKRYAQVGKTMKEAFASYRQDVERGLFPDSDRCPSDEEDEQGKNYDNEE